MASTSLATLALAALLIASGQLEAFELRVASYNIAGVNPEFAGNPRPRVEKIADWVVWYRLDFVAFQEVTRGTSALNGANVHRLLKNALEKRGWLTDSRYAQRFQIDGGNVGNSIFSRYPIASHGIHRFTKKDIVQIAELVLAKNRTVWAFNFHPIPTKACLRISQLEGVVSGYPGPSILLGDFNALADGGCLDGILSTYRDACAESLDKTCLETVDDDYHTGGVQAVDYVFLRGPWSVAQAHAFHRMNEGLAISDHYPLAAVLECQEGL